MSILVPHVRSEPESLRFCVSNKPLGDIDAGPQTTLSSSRAGESERI